MKLANASRPRTPEEGIYLIEQLIVPTLVACDKFQSDKKILAGGPVAGAITLVMIVNAESNDEVEELVESLPVWPNMETTVTPLTTFDARRAAMSRKAQALEAKKSPTPWTP